MARHEILRTIFPSREGQPSQVITPAGPLRVPLLDLSGLEAGAAAEFPRLVAAEAWRPFDLARGSLLRALLIRLGDRDSVLVLSLHHIASDGWSISLLVRELAALYPAFAGGEPSPLRPLPVQYADYACWQRQWLQGEVLKAQLAYWTRQLAGAATVLDLPADRPRPAMPTFRGGTERLVIPAPLPHGLHRLARREGSTPFMALLAVFQTLLLRYTGAGGRGDRALRSRAATVWRRRR